jgi:hypothetical protein
MRWVNGWKKAANQGARRLLGGESAAAVLGEALVLERGGDVLVAGDEPRGLLARQRHPAHRLLGAKPGVEGKWVRFEFRACDVDIHDWYPPRDRPVG